jgi:hypothetical protein
MVCALRDDSWSSSRNRGSRAISLAQRTQARLVADQHAVRDGASKRGRQGVK